ncbi:MAG: N-6 DNA methylase, partial [Nocardia sp.]|nr:N-6 DNA methylase [Nocardia sp.]
NGLSTGALAIRRMLVEDNNLTHVIELPSGVFRPYSDVKTAILLWRREAFEDAVRMIRIDNDGFSLDQRRTPLRENDLHQAVRIVNGQESTLAHADVSLDELIGNNHNLTPSRYLPRRTTHIAPQRLAKTAVSLGDALGRLTAIHEHLAPVEALLSFDGSGCIAVAELVTPVRTLLEPDNINPDALYILLEHITTTTGEVTGLRAGDTEIRSPKFAFDEGDVLYGKLRPALRKCAVAPAPGICSTDLIPLRPVHAGTSFLLSAVLRSPQFTAEVTRLVSGANLPRVNVKELLALHVPWPSEDQVQHFEDLTRLAHELREEARTLASGIDDLETNLTAAMNSH